MGLRQAPKKWCAWLPQWASWPAVQQVVSHHKMTPLTKAIVVLLVAAAALAFAAVTSHGWVPFVFVDVGTGLLLFAAFSMALLILSVGLIWTSVLSWLEYRRGAMQGLPAKATALLGAVVGGVVSVCALRFWGVL